MSSRPRLHSRRSSGAEGRGRPPGRPDGEITSLAEYRRRRRFSPTPGAPAGDGVDLWPSLRRSRRIVPASPTHEGEVGRDSVRASEELTRARAARVGFLFGALTLSLGLLAGCATSSPAVASDYERDKSACVRASVGYNDSSYSLPFGRLPFDIDRDAYRRCMEARGYHLPPSGIEAP